METISKEMTPQEYAQRDADDLNAVQGNLNELDGYNCNICKNRGYIVRVVDGWNGTFTTASRDCDCMKTRRSIRRMERSGLKDVIQKYTFAKYEDAEPWQKAIKSAAMEYAKNPSGWFFIGGQSGAGKTHLCTAICREFLLGGKAVMYMLWRDEVAKLKNNPGSPEYVELIEKYKNAEVLYIDDLFKVGKHDDYSAQKPTVGDINVAFELINYRYNNPSMLTIISSELTEDELLDIDEAIGGRIFERAKAFSVAKDRRRNYRIRGAVTI